jgi:uncharacterized membrane protein
MKPVLANLRGTVISGILFLLPVFVVAYIIQKAWKGLTGFGNQLAKTLGVDSIGGFSTGPIVTTLVLIALFYGCGLLVRIAMITKLRNWLENAFLKYIPGYVKYKVKMEEKLLPPEDTRKPVLVQLNQAWKPGFLVETRGEEAVVFMPHTPETDTGDVWVIHESHLRPLHMDAKQFRKSLELSGYGLINTPAQKDQG